MKLRAAETSDVAYLQEVALDQATADLDISQAEGLASQDLSRHPLVSAVVSEAVTYYDQAKAARRTFPSKQSLDFVGSANKDFGADSAMFKFASSPLVLAPIVRYFDCFPYLTGFGVTLARNQEFFRKSSQRFHFDPEDRSQIKLFVYLTDVDAASGPFMAAPAHKCAHLFENPDFVLDRLDDDVVEDGALREFHGPAGTVIFCDTCQCLHAGARPGDRERLMLSVEYNLPTHLGASLFPKDSEPSRSRTQAIRPETPDDYVKALLNIGDGSP